MNVSQQSGISKEQLLRHQACPMTASVNWDPRKDMMSDVAQWYAYFNKLPLAIRWGLVDKEIVDQVLSLAKNHGIYDEFKIGEVSRIVRENFFKPTTSQQLTERVREKLEKTGQEAISLAEAVAGVIGEVERVGKERVMEVTESIPIIPALKKFPQLRNQTITKNNIKLFDTKEFVTPSVGNWIDDYIQRKGAQAHNNIQRSDYIFNSENGLKLDGEDQKKLGVLLESYDNDSALHVNSESQEIMFSGGFEPEKKVERKEIVEPEAKQEQTTHRDYFGNIIKPDFQPAEAEDRRGSLPGQTTTSSQTSSQKAGPPQPQVDAMPEKDAMLQDWKRQNLETAGQRPSEQLQQTESSGQQEQKIENKPETQQRIEVRKSALPYEKRQEIGWFGESTGIEEPGKQENQAIKTTEQDVPIKGKKEVSYGHPRTVTRNYREIEDKTRQGSKHVINLKEVV